MSLGRCRAFAAMAAAAALLLVGTTPGADGAFAASTAECCSSCIGKTADSVYDYDPVVYDQCRLSPNGARVCCFECGTWGEPTYGDSISYASDGTTPTIKAGTWVSMTWSAAKKVTYISLKSGQKKTVTPTVNDTAATIQSNYFMICAKSTGSIVFRGWGSDSCRQASPEKNITVIEGDAGASCEAKTPTAPTGSSTSASSSSSSSGSEDANLQSCNLNRASIKEVDGKKQCVCVSDWAGEPACDQMPTWKWVITIGGGIAALFSILISVHAFMKSREKKKKADEDAMDTPTQTKDDVEVLRIGADRASPNAPKHTDYKRGYDDSHGVYKMNDREFSL